MILGCYDLKVLFDHFPLPGADVDATNNKMETPLFLATSWMSNPETVKVLLEAGADTNLVTEEGFSPLHEASFLRSTNISRALLDSDARVDAQTWADELTPLHVATYTHKLDSVQLLVANGADPNAKTVNSLTPVHLAARFLDNEHILSTLIQAGTVPHILRFYLCLYQLVVIVLQLDA